MDAVPASAGRNGMLPTLQQGRLADAEPAIRFG